MKVLLVNPPQTFYPGSEQPAGNLPIGLMYIAAVLEKADYETEILDAFMAESTFQKNGDTINVGMPLISTEDFTASEVKEIAAKALEEYKKLSLINHIRNPRRALKTAFDQPQLILKYLKNLSLKLLPYVWENSVLYFFFVLSVTS